MKKIPKLAYTTEFKELAVKRVTVGNSIAGIDRLGICFKVATRLFWYRKKRTY